MVTVGDPEFTGDLFKIIGKKLDFPDGFRIHSKKVIWRMWIK